MKKQDLKQIIREEIRKVLKEATMSFSYAKPFVGPQSELAKVKTEIDAFIKQLQQKNYSARPGGNCIYFPKYKTYGPTVAVMVGSDTMFLKPIGSNTMLKVAEKLIARKLQSGELEGHLIPGNE
jgi:hypothetical protein